MKKFNKTLAVYIIIILMIVVTGIFLFRPNKPTTTSATLSKTSADQDSEPVVPELYILHDSIAVLWHTAYPKKDLNIIKNTLPKLVQSTTNLAKAKLPGILQDKQTLWQKGVKDFQSKVKDLEKATNNNEINTALQLVESLHTEYENLASILRPKLPELENFHQELYKVYHYYFPEGNTEKIINSVSILQERFTSLKEVTLPTKYEDKQEQFNQSVQRLKIALDEVEASPKNKSSVENLHTAYQEVEAIFQ